MEIIPLFAELRARRGSAGQAVYCLGQYFINDGKQGFFIYKTGTPLAQDNDHQGNFPVSGALPAGQWYRDTSLDNRYIILSDAITYAEGINPNAPWQEGSFWVNNGRIQRGMYLGSRTRLLNKGGGTNINGDYGINRYGFQYTFRQYSEIVTNPAYIPTYDPEFPGYDMSYPGPDVNGEFAEIEYPAGYTLHAGTSFWFDDEEFLLTEDKYFAPGYLQSGTFFIDSSFNLTFRITPVGTHGNVFVPGKIRLHTLRVGMAGEGGGYEVVAEDTVRYRSSRSTDVVVETDNTNANDWTGAYGDATTGQPTVDNEDRIKWYRLYQQGTEVYIEFFQKIKVLDAVEPDEPVTLGQLTEGIGADYQFVTEAEKESWDNKVDKDGAKVLSDNNFTTLLMTAYDSAVSWISTNAPAVLAAATWVATHGANVLSGLAGKATQSDIDASIITYDNLLKDGVSADFNTLKKIGNAILAGFNEKSFATITERDAYNVTHLPFQAYVINDGDGKWAIYKAATTGVGATFGKTMDEDSLNNAMSAWAIAASYESNPDTFRLTGALRTAWNAASTWVTNAGANIRSTPMTGLPVTTTGNGAATDDLITLLGKLEYRAQLVTAIFSVASSSYIRGDGSSASFGGGVRATTLNTVTPNNVPITTGQTLQAMANSAQGQFNFILSELAAEITRATTAEGVNATAISTLNTIITGTSDADSIINAFQEVVAAMSGLPEGITLVGLQALKVSISDLVNGVSSVTAGFALDSRVGKLLNDAIVAEVTRAGLAETANATEIALQTPRLQLISGTTRTADFTLVLADNANLILVFSNTPLTITLADCATRFHCDILTRGLGQITFVTASGITMESSGARYKSSMQHAMMHVVQLNSTTFSLSGDLTI